MREAPAADPSGFDKAGDPASNGTASPRAAAGPLHRLAQATALTALLLAIVVVVDIVGQGSAEGRGGFFAGAVAILAAVNLVAALLLRRAALDHAKREVAISSQHFRDAIENLSEGILMFDAGGAVGGWNRRLLELMPHLRSLLRIGIGSRELGIAAVEAAHPGWSAAQKAAWVEHREASLRRDDHSEELSLGDGRIVQVRHRRARGGGIVAVYRDISREHDAVAALATSEARFREAVDSMGEGLTLWDRDGRLLLWNERLRVLLPHLTADLKVGVTIEEINADAARRMHPDWSAEQIDALVTARLAARGTAAVPFVLEMPSGRVVEITDSRTSEGGLVSVYRDITDARRAAAEIAASEARFRDAVDSMGEGLTLWDRDGRLLLWNARFLTLLPDVAPGLRVGLSAEQINTTAARRMFPDWSEEQITTLVAERLGARRSFGTAFLLTLRDGRIIEFVDHGTSEGGQVTIYRDVTLAHRATEILAKTEARFRNAIASLGEGFALWDAADCLVAWNERFIDINRQYADVFREGVKFEDALRELARRNSAWLAPEGHEDWIARRLARRREGGRSELRFDCGMVVEIVDHRATDGGIVSIYRDITEERRALDRLRQSEARFRDGIQSMADGFVMWDAEDRLVTWNERHLEMLPYLRPHLHVGRPRRDIVVAAAADGLPHLPAAAREAWVAERIASFRQYDQIFILRPVGGRVIEVVERRTTEGGSVVLYRDITEREQQTNDLRRALTVEREANQQQRRFIAIASHEFRTPLTVIDGSAQRLLAHLENAAPDVTKRLQRIRATVLRMTQLIERTLTSARLDDGRMELRPERFDLAAMLREACARQGSISAEFTLALDAPPSAEITGDPRLLELVLTNLLSNAVKYSGASRMIEVGLTHTATDVSIAVRDHGIGVPEAEVPRLFQRFFRASTAAGIPGTGIGLHLVRELVAMHGGTIEVESRLGVGSTFKVTLPRVASAPATAARPGA